MLGAHERNELREGILRIRDTEAIFPIDLWGDAPYVGGCIAGKRYLHITSDGWVEPCIFAHFATHNIHQASLLEAWTAPLFRELRRRQPFNKNLLPPCMLIDDPHHSWEIAAACGALPTHPGADSYFTELRDDLDEYAAEVGRVYGPIWERIGGDFNPPLH